MTSLNISTFKKYINITRYIFLDKNTKKFIKFCKLNFKLNKSEVKKSKILVELSSIDQLSIPYAFFLDFLSKKFKSKIYSFSSQECKSLFSRIKFYILKRRFLSIYKAFNSDHIYSSLNCIELNAKSHRLYTNALKSLKRKEDLINLKVLDTNIGMGVYEGYLIERMKPTVSFEDKQFKAYLKECIDLLVFWRDYFDSNQVEAIILSHALYKFDIIKEAALKKGIKVYLPSLHGIHQILKPGDIAFHGYENYSKEFKSLPSDIKENGIAWAKNRLDLRMSGRVGVDMNYATKSAYSNKRFLNIIEKNNKPKILISTHCFFDNPNAYGKNLFADFYEWLDFLGKITDETDYDWYLKAHPDAFSENHFFIDEIISKYKKIKKLPDMTSHKQLKEEGIKYILTVYGSIGHEAPLNNQIVINAGTKNPHESYNFNLHASSIKQYRDILLSLPNLFVDINPDKVYEFYFMHYLATKPDKLFLSSALDFEDSIPPNLQNTPHIYKYFINQFDESSKKFIYETIENFVSSNEIIYRPNNQQIRDLLNKYSTK